MQFEQPGTAPADPPPLPPTAVEALPTLLVTREIREHANVFHTLTGEHGRGWRRWCAGTGGGGAGQGGAKRQ